VWAHRPQVHAAAAAVPPAQVLGAAEVSYRQHLAACHVLQLQVGQAGEHAQLWGLHAPSKEITTGDPRISTS
jgi:hypothetical protein